MRPRSAIPWPQLLEAAHLGRQCWFRLTHQVQSALMGRLTPSNMSLPIKKKLLGQALVDRRDLLVRFGDGFCRIDAFDQGELQRFGDDVGGEDFA